MSTEFTSPVETPPAGATPPEQFTSPHEEIRVNTDGRQLKTSPGFARALDKAEQKKDAPEKTEDTRKGGLFDKSSKSEKKDAPADPIAKANAAAAEEKAPKAEAKSDRPVSRTASLLEKDEEDDKESEAPAEKKESKSDKAEKPATEESPVTDTEIEEEMKTPKSAKSERRFRHLHSQWKAAEAKAAETAKQVAEKEQKLAQLEAQMKEQATKAAASGQLDPDIQKKLDELQMYQRQFELESSDHVKQTFDARISRQEENIYARLTEGGIKFKGMDEKTSIDLIKKMGGFRAFARKEPDLVDGILDRLNVADRKEVEAAMMGQTMLEQERKGYIDTEKGRAKEYFEKKQKEEQAARANEEPPEKRREAQQKAVEKLKTEMFEKHAFFKDTEIPADASPEEKKRLSDDNAFADNLRKMFADSLIPKNDEEVINVALEATLAHKFKRDNVALRRELKQLKADLEKVKNGSKTSTRGGAIPTTMGADKISKPAAGFGAALDKAQERRGSGM